MKKLLILTQKMDKNDPVLGFFENWVREFSKSFEMITVVCLEKGVHELPQNVKVLSLGKERGLSRIDYLIRFFSEIISKRKEYDAVFVHMNQEYILLAGWLWKLFGKKVYMWRNHHSGSILTDIASVFCNKVFCTSKFSYTAKYKKTILMPVGIDTDIFKKTPDIKKQPASILFLARIAPVKKAHILVEALGILKTRGINFNAHIYGNPLPKDVPYHKKLKMNVKDTGLQDLILFHAGVPNAETVRVYNSYEIFVNLSSSGMYDKTIFEAMSCETLTLASNENLRGLVDDNLVFKESDIEDLVIKLQYMLALSLEDKSKLSSNLRSVVIKNHSLSELSKKLVFCIKSL